MSWLRSGEKISKICLFFLTQSTNVTDRHTDTAWRLRPRLMLASRGKNDCWSQFLHVISWSWHIQNGLYCVSSGTLNLLYCTRWRRQDCDKKQCVHFIARTCWIMKVFNNWLLNAVIPPKFLFLYKISGVTFWVQRWCGVKQEIEIQQPW